MSAYGGQEPAPEPASQDVVRARRALLTATVGIAVSTGPFGFVYGLSARAAGFSTVEAATSLLPFAGASQLAAVGYVRLGLDVVFPAAMAGLAVGLPTGRLELVAAAACVALVAWRRNVLLGLAGAVGPVALARATGLA